MKEINEDDIILFIKEQKQEVADNGFSKRVMRRLPSHKHAITTWVDVALTAACLCLFAALGGFDFVRDTLNHFMACVNAHAIGHLLSDTKLMLACAIAVVSLTITYFYNTEEG